MANATCFDWRREQLHVTYLPCPEGEEFEASQARHKSVAPQGMFAARLVVTYLSRRSELREGGSRSTSGKSFAVTKSSLRTELEARLPPVFAPWWRIAPNGATDMMCPA